MRPLVSDWHTAPEKERREARYFLILIAYFMVIDALLYWWAA